MSALFDYAVVGGGIVGLATALKLGERHPSARVLVLEKENSPALHQTGRNSGVIHSGIYYKPGSYKARFARAGAESMRAFCERYGIPHDICGKLIVATRQSEVPLLDNLYARALQNGVPVERISVERAREIEPHVACIAALHVKSTGITSYRAVCLEYLRQIQERCGTVHFGKRVRRITGDGTPHRIECEDGDVFESRFTVNCGGLYSDRIARASGVDPQAKIVPFRGEYYELIPSRRQLVKTLIYPVPNPQFPFLGVHFTRMIDGSVHAGPNAVLAFAREGYFKRTLHLGDLAETLLYGGFWRLAHKNMGEGMHEVWRSLSKHAFTRSLQQLIPEVRERDLVPCAAGVRAQALGRDGKLVDDFLILKGRNTLHVCNAPSPAATASLEIGAEVASQVPDAAARSTPLSLSQS